MLGILKEKIAQSPNLPCSKECQLTLIVRINVNFEGNHVSAAWNAICAFRNIDAHGIPSHGFHFSCSEFSCSVDGLQNIFSF